MADGGVNKLWTPWLFVQVGVPLAPLGLSAFFAALGRKAEFKWVEDVLWGNELPFMALGLCVPAFLQLKGRLDEAARGGWSGELLHLAMIAMGLVCAVPIAALMVVYIDKYEVFGWSMSAQPAAKAFACVAMGVLVLIGFIAAVVQRAVTKNGD